MKNIITRLLIVVAILGCTINYVHAQRQMDKLDRGVVAVKVNNGVYVSWRIPGYEWNGVSYNLYRDGTKLNSDPITGASNYTDASGTLASNYTVSAIINGVEQAQSSPVSVWGQQYKEITLKPRSSQYAPTEACAGDLDGDGQYEILVKRLCQDWSVANDTAYSFIEAYKLDGTFMWEINIGPNIVMDSNISLGVYDLDGDGKAEIFMRTSEGMIDGKGNKMGDIGNAAGELKPDGLTNYRYAMNQGANMVFQCAGPEMLSLFDGETGEELDRVPYIDRGNVNDWGDGYGHRAGKFMYGAPYLDGRKPSIMISRGIYTRIVIRTFDVVVDGQGKKKMVQRWNFDTNDSGNSGYAGQGNHNYAIADVDGDGCDEIVYGSMTVNNDGKGLYTTRLGHGDALHVGNFDPYRKGIEVFQCHENVGGTSLRAAEDGTILIRHNQVGDTGRCGAGNTSNLYKGAEVWGGGKVHSASTRQQIENYSPGSENFRIFWDGDLLDETLNHNGYAEAEGTIIKGGVGSSKVIFTATGTKSSNWTKGVPMLQADLFGDWREEVIWKTEDLKKIRIYTTTTPTIHRVYTLMHDMQYNQAICWQNCEYNQPPHPSFFIGEAEGILLPPPPVMTNNRQMLKTGNTTWNKSTSVWVKDGSTQNYMDDQEVLFCENGTITLTENVSPSVMTINSKDNYTFVMNGALGGRMKFVKQGLGTTTMNGTHTYSGVTELWDGMLDFNGTLTNSPVWMSLHSIMQAKGTLDKGLTMEYNAQLHVGADHSNEILTIGTQLWMKEGAVLLLDINTPQAFGDQLTINGDLKMDNLSKVKINTKETPAYGRYPLITYTGEFTGNLSKIKVEVENMVAGTKKLEQDGKTIYLVLGETRQASSVKWDGSQTNSIWDISVSENFANADGLSDFFVKGDQVTFDDQAKYRTVNIADEVEPTSVVVSAKEEYTFAGNGKITGATGFMKEGEGWLTMKNVNSYTGPTSLSGGRIDVQSQLATTIEDGAFGKYSSNAANFTLKDSVILTSSTKELNTEQPITIGSNGATIEVQKNMALRGVIKGTTLTKTGTATLSLAGNNGGLDRLIIEDGTVSLVAEDANQNPAKNITMNGGFLSALNNIGSYSNTSVNVDVPEGKEGRWRLDGRCNYKGALTGSGTLNLEFVDSRNNIMGNWSAFTGVLKVSGSNARMGKTTPFSLANAELHLLSSAEVASWSTDDRSMTAITFRIGALSGTGKLTGPNTWIVGSKNTDCKFDGQITNGKLEKVGTGKLILTGASTYTAGTTVTQGLLDVQGTATASPTGTGYIFVNGTNATTCGEITGTGTISSGIIVNGYGRFNMQHPSRKSIKVKSLLMNSDNATLLMDLQLMQGRPWNDQIEATERITVGGKLYLRLAGGQYAVGQAFKIFNAPEILGSFASVDHDLPSNMDFDLSTLNTDGTIRVIEKESGVEHNPLSQVSAYPNPCRDKCIIKLGEQSQESVIQIISILGQTVYSCKVSAGVSEVTLQTAQLLPGNYIVTVVSGGKITRLKIVKQ